MAETEISGGKVCRKCGVLKPLDGYHKKVSNPDGLRTACRECRAIEKRAYYEANKSRTLKQQKEYRDSHKESERERHRRWRRANPEKVAASQAAWWARHPGERKKWTAKYKDIAAVRSRLWREANRQRCCDFTKKWQAKNPEERTRANHRRRAMKRGAGGSHTRADLRALLDAQAHRCANPYCGVDLRKVKKHLDHIVPLCAGGTNDVKNLQWLCQPCNLRKNRLAVHVWLERERKAP